MNPALTQRFPGIRLGLIGGASLVLLSLIGMVEAFNQREIISDVISMGQTLLLFTAVFIGYLAAKRGRERGQGQVFGSGITAGLIMAGMLALLVLLGHAINMRQVFINASPVLFQILIFQQEELWAGIGLLLLAGVLIGLSAALLCLLPHWLRRVITTGLCSVAVVGLLQDLIAPIFSVWDPLADIIELLFPGNGLSVSGAVGLFIVVAALSAFWSFKGQAVQTRIQALPPKAGAA